VPRLRFDLYSFTACRPSYAISYVFTVTNHHQPPVAVASYQLLAWLPSHQLQRATSRNSDSTFHL